MDDMLQVHDANQPVIFGIRHLSPAGAWHLRELLDKLMPELVLIEGPSDFSEEIVCLPDKNTKPPIAIMAYTSEPPVRTILLPDIHLNTRRFSGHMRTAGNAVLLICHPEYSWHFLAVKTEMKIQVKKNGLYMISCLDCLVMIHMRHSGNVHLNIQVMPLDIGKGQKYLEETCVGLQPGRIAVMQKPLYVKLI